MAPPRRGGTLLAVDAPSRPPRYGLLAWTVLWFTVAVILGGSVVRGTGSGAGCGETWPRCEGSIFPFDGSLETGIEFTHRISTATLGILLAMFVVWTVRTTRKGDPVRSALAWTATFFIGEVVIGAMLVVFGWVDLDASLGRLVAVPVHLMNTFLLLGAMTFTAYFAGGGRPPNVRLSRLQDRLLLIGLAALLLVGASGALNALADSLFPSETFIEGIRAEFSATAPFLIRVRILHPVIAVIGGIAAFLLVRHPEFDPEGRARGPVRLVVGIVAFQFLTGLVNVAMATPIEIQVVHLFVADAMWIALLIAGLRVLSPDRVARGSGQRARVAS